MEFVHNWVLLLLSLVPIAGVLWYWLAARAANRLSMFVSGQLQEKLAPRSQRWRANLQITLMLVGAALLLVALARPRWGTSTQTVYSRSRNVLVALDVSRSMLARDVHPNRLERAKVDLLDLIGELNGDRAGLLVFRGKANLLCPLTTDTAFLRQILDGVTIDSAPRGSTDLALAIRRSLDALEPVMDAHNAILLISDGEELTGTAIDAAREAGKRGVPIFTVGIGNPDGASIPDGDGVQKDASGKAVTTRLMESTLSAIASESGGAYVPLATAGTAHTTLGSIYRQHLRRVAAKEQQETLERRYVERYQIFLIPAILLFCAAGMLSLGRFGKSKKAAAAIVLAALALNVSAEGTNETAAVDGTAPDTPSQAAVAPSVKVGREGAREAQALYRRGKMEEAAKAYLDAARGVEADEAATYRHNAAVAYFEASDYTNATETLLPIARLQGRAEDAELLAFCQYKAAEAAGTNLAAKVEALEESAQGFQQALRGAPDDERRQRNLARLLATLPEAREEAHIAEVMERLGKIPPDQLLSQMLREQRAIFEETPAALTNSAPAMIPAMEALAKRQREQADAWIPLKEAMIASPSITNEQQRAMVAQLVEQSRDAMRAAAGQLRDLDGMAVQATAACEPVIYGLWRDTAMPPPLLDEAIALQMNALANPKSPVFPIRPDQPEAAALMQGFSERFPQWADQMQQQAQADTNAPSFTAEDRAEIERLTAEVLDLHGKIAQTTEPAELQRQALDDMIKIRELLPKQSNQSQSQQQQNQQQQQDQDQQQDQQNQNQEDQDQQQSEQEQQQQEQESEDEQQQEQQPQPLDEKKDEPPPDVQEMLRRVLQREKDHEEQKKRQNQQIPMRPDERDW